MCNFQNYENKYNNSEKCECLEQGNGRGNDIIAVLSQNSYSIYYILILTWGLGIDKK